jgi:DNA-binding MarR family transcriptional regulator
MVMGGALAGTMNSITFGTKRAFHGFLRVTRKPLASMGLTAARFDMLWMLLTARTAEWLPRGVRQSELRKRLGVSAPVVTRMVRALEVLGLVAREREERGDRRQIRVWLTEVGQGCILEARSMMLRAMRRLVYIAICFGQHRDASKRLIHMDTLESYLRSLRSAFGDTATLYYPWGHPDD